MTQERAGTLAWGIAAFEFACFVASVVLAYLARTSFGTMGGPGFWTIVSLTAPSLAYPVFGALIASRRPENAVGWLCLLVGGLWFVGTVQIAYGAYGVVAHPGGLPAAAYVGSASSWVPQVGVLGTFFLLYFPDGHLPSRRFVPVAWLAGVSIVALTAVEIFSTPTVAWYGGTHNPLLATGHAEAVLKSADALLDVAMLAAVVASIASLFIRYRRGRTDQREKLKWIAFAGVLFLAILIVSVVAWGRGTDASLPVKVMQDSIGVGAALIPASALFAVLRYRLYEIDRVISRTISYAIITAVLAGSYTLVAIVPPALIGANHVPPGFVAAAVLVAAGIAGPVRRRVQNAVDRRFNRARYDAARTVEAFTARLRDAVDIDSLGTELADVVRRTMHPSTVALWVPERARFTARPQG